MHELSIAMGIVKIAEDETRKAEANKVTKIELEIGVLSGVEISSLEFVWDSAVEGSVLEQAERQINIIKGEGKCADCNTLYPMKNIYDSCPKCNSNLKGVLKGKELKVTRLELI